MDIVTKKKRRKQAALILFGFMLIIVVIGMAKEIASILSGTGSIAYLGKMVVTLIGLAFCIRKLR